MALMLSHPTTSLGSLATRSLNSLSITTFLSLFVSRSCLMWVTIFWLLATYLSHTPSHPIMMKLSSCLRSNTITSGIDITACCSQGMFEKCLYSKSPNERDKLKVPLTRPFLTYPPAFSILFFYSGRSGLWSLDRPTALQERLSTALESPILATQYLALVMSKTTAVDPARYPTFYPFDVPNFLLMALSSSQPRLLIIKSSIFLNTLLKAFEQFFCLKKGSLSNYLGSTSATQFAISGPPCPSNTPNKETPSVIS